MARRPIAFSVQKMSPATRQSRGHRSRVNVSLALEGIDRSLKRLSRRLRRENPLGEAIVLLRTRYEEFESDFESFFPDLAAFTRRERPDVISRTPGR